MKIELDGVIIHSGEGDYGVLERHTGKPTLAAIRRRLTLERCNGDRWARAWIPAGNELAPDTYYDLDTEELRTIPDHHSRKVKP